LNLQPRFRPLNILYRATEDAEFWSTVINWNTVNYGGSKTSAPSSATSSAAASPIIAAEKVATTSSKPASATSSAASAAKSSAAPASPSSASNNAAGSLLNGIVGVANSLTSFGAATQDKGQCPGIQCINNVGNPYGSNIIKVSSTSGQAYTNTFVNTQKEGITVNIWNKAGADGQANSGQSTAPKSTTLTFVLGPGASQVVAFMENTSGGFAQATTDVATDGWFDTTWGEWTYLNGGSAYDVSAIQNSKGNNYNMTMTSSEAACTSDMTKNMWLTPTNAIGPDGKAVQNGGDCVALGSSLHITTTLGGTV